jgi:transcription antitermination protein NusB
MPRTRVETRARARALQALYAWDLRSNEVRQLDRIATQIWDDLIVPPDERALAMGIVRTLQQNATVLDRELADVTTNWRLERLGVIDRCVLRLAAAELHRGDTPPRVVIHEAVRLAERYGSVQSAKFVNGVLDALARRMGRM